jgi:hypothetical protein
MNVKENQGHQKMNNRRRSSLKKKEIPKKNQKRRRSVRDNLRPHS